MFRKNIQTDHYEVIADLQLRQS